MTTAQLRASRRLWARRASIWRGRLARAKTEKRKAYCKRKLARALRIGDRRDRQLQAKSDARWGGSRYYTTRANKVVWTRHPGTRTTSRKRPVLLGNMNSDHNLFIRTADARDWALVNDHATKNAISRANGGPDEIADFGTWTTVHDGHTYRHQIIAGTHGTGPHLHYGVRRVG